MGRVLSILIHHTETLPPSPVDSAEVSTSGGLVGDSHDGGRAHRQVLLTDSAILDEKALKPGDLREQITIEGLAVDQLAEGTRIAIGDASAEVQGECKPCLTIGGYLGVEDVEAFRDEMTNKRGMFVLFRSDSYGKRISVGDEVSILQEAHA